MDQHDWENLVMPSYHYHFAYPDHPARSLIEIVLLANDLVIKPGWLENLPCRDELKLDLPAMFHSQRVSKENDGFFLLLVN